MNDARMEWISKRAYALWEQEGRPFGRDLEHWVQAARERDEFERVALPGTRRGKTAGDADRLTEVAVASAKKPRSDAKAAKTAKVAKPKVATH